MADRQNNTTDTKESVREKRIICTFLEKGTVFREKMGAFEQCWAKNVIWLSLNRLKPQF